MLSIENSVWKTENQPGLFPQSEPKVVTQTTGAKVRNEKKAVPMSKIKKRD